MVTVDEKNPSFQVNGYPRPRVARRVSRRKGSRQPARRQEKAADLRSAVGARQGAAADLCCRRATAESH